MTMAIDGAETHLRLRHEVGRVLIGQALAVEELDDLEPLVGEAVELRHNGLRQRCTHSLLQPQPARASSSAGMGLQTVRLDCGVSAVVVGVG